MYQQVFGTPLSLSHSGASDFSARKTPTLSVECQLKESHRIVQHPFIFDNENTQGYEINFPATWWEPEQISLLSGQSELLPPQLRCLDLTKYIRTGRNTPNISF